LQIDSAGVLYATDPGSSTVIAFEPGGAESGRWSADDEGSRFDRPTGLALDRKAGILYVINSGNSRVMKLTIASKKP
jgi:DNA-binding beta-propeller fold protein YncE